MNQIVFIGGSGRCGTHITKDILSRHSRVCSLPFEYRFIIDPDGIVDFYTSMRQCWSPYLFDRKLKRLLNLFTDLTGPSYRYANWDLRKHIPGFENMICDLHGNLRDFHYDCKWVGSVDESAYFARHKDAGELASILGGFIIGIADAICSEGCDVFVEDNTWNILFAKELLELVPDAKIIHVYRDPRDVVDSMSNQKWCPGDKVEAARFYAGIMDRWLEVKGSLADEQFIEIDLESLVFYPGMAVSTMCAHIGIEPQAQMFDTEPEKAHIGRWKTGFTAEDREKVLPILEPYIERLGYTIEGHDFNTVFNIADS